MHRQPQSVDTTAQITGVTRLVPTQVSAGTTGPICLRQGGGFHAFSQPCCTKCNMVVKKQNEVLRCRRRNTPVSRANGLFACTPRTSCQITIIHEDIQSNRSDNPAPAGARTRVCRRGWHSMDVRLPACGGLEPPLLPGMRGVLQNVSAPPAHPTVRPVCAAKP